MGALTTATKSEVPEVLLPPQALQNTAPRKRSLRKDSTIPTPAEVSPCAVLLLMGVGLVLFIAAVLYAAEMARPGR